MEERLATWVQGGDDTFYDDEDEGRGQREQRYEESDEFYPDPVRQRVEAMKSIDEQQLLRELPTCLEVFLKNRLLKIKEENPEEILEEKHVKACLTEARDKGPPEVSKSGPVPMQHVCLNLSGQKEWAGLLSTTRGANGMWSTTGTSCRFIHHWKLSLERHPPARTPRRSGNASYFTAPEASWPRHRESTGPLRNFIDRHKTARLAQTALEHLGEMPDEMTRAEADVRVFIHDFIHYNHDKDYRCLVAFPTDHFEAVKFHIVRMDQQGELTAEDITGLLHRNGKDPEVWLLVANGHMRLLGKPKGAEEPPLIRDVLAAGWEVHLEAAEGPVARVGALGPS